MGIVNDFDLAARADCPTTNSDCTGVIPLVNSWLSVYLVVGSIVVSPDYMSARLGISYLGTRLHRCRQYRTRWLCHQDLSTAKCRHPVQGPRSGRSPSTCSIEVTLTLGIWRQTTGFWLLSRLCRCCQTDDLVPGRLYTMKYTPQFDRPFPM